MNQNIARYQKQIKLPEMGLAGQQKLNLAKVLVVGAGGLGCPVLQYLVAAGVGNIGIIDNDFVAESNLHRQILYSQKDIGKSKVEVAKERLLAQNPFVEITTFQANLNASNAQLIIQQYNLVIDCTDNFTARYLINDHCVAQHKPFVYGAIHHFSGQVAVFNYTDSEEKLGPTYRCAFPNQPSASEIPNCDEVGVIGLVPGIIGLYQAIEALKIITGIGTILSGQLLLVDLLDNTTQKIKIKRMPDADKVIFAAIDNPKYQSISVKELQQWQAQNKDFQLIDVRLEYEFGICKLENAQLIPLNDIENKINQIDQNRPVVFYCHHGIRSAKAIETILKHIPKLTNLINLEGGIHEWASLIDDTMEKY